MNEAALQYGTGKTGMEVVVGGMRKKNLRSQTSPISTFGRLDGMTLGGWRSGRGRGHFDIQSFRGKTHHSTAPVTSLNIPFISM